MATTTDSPFKFPCRVYITLIGSGLLCKIIDVQNEILMYLIWNFDLSVLCTVVLLNIFSSIVDKTMVEVLFYFDKFS